MHHPLRKITVEKIHQILSLKAEGWKQQSIAEELGTSVSMVSLVLAGKRHAQYTGLDPRDYTSPRTTPEQVAKIVELGRQGLCRKEIAYRCNRSTQTVGDILRGIRHSRISGIRRGA